MSEEQPSFKVTDRRLFNADGSPRELDPEEKPEPEVTGAVADAESTPEPPPQPAQEPDVDEVDLADAQDPASFVNFLMSIASNAASTLGMIEHPVTHQREVDLEAAKHWIDVIGMLQQKTRGNLTPQESQIVEGLLADLRMQYVSLTSSPQAKAARSYTGRDIVGGK